jgi:hypothetical protein
MVPKKLYITYQWLCILKFCIRDYSINAPVWDIWQRQSQGKQHFNFFPALTISSKLYWQPTQLQHQGKRIVIPVKV